MDAFYLKVVCLQQAAAPSSHSNMGGREDDWQQFSHL